MRSVMLSSIVALLACAACERSSSREAAETDNARVRASSPAGCYRSTESVLGRTTPLDGHATVAPGWLRFDPAATRDSGGVLLVDADGGFFEARWRRAAGDSIELTGADDFMRLAVRATLADSILAGTGDLTSDAELQRDSAGQLQPLHRTWGMRAVAVSCDSVPKPAG